MERLKKLKSDKLAARTSLLSLVLVALYIIKGFTESFIFSTYAIIIINIAYVVLNFYLGRRGYYHFMIFYAVAVVFLIAFDDTKLYNNYTGIILILIVAISNPKLKNAAFQIYLAAVLVAFLLNDEDLIFYLIHTIQTLWLYYTVLYFITNRYEIKTLNLTNDEREILQQIVIEKKLQKEVRGYSENTITRKLGEACERNGLTKEELKANYRLQPEALKNAE